MYNELGVSSTVLIIKLVDLIVLVFFFFQAEDGIRDYKVTGVQTCALPIFCRPVPPRAAWPGPAPARPSSGAPRALRPVRAAGYGRGGGSVPARSPVHPASRPRYATPTGPSLPAAGLWRGPRGPAAPSRPARARPAA